VNLSAPPMILILNRHEVGSAQLPNSFALCVEESLCDESFESTIGTSEVALLQARYKSRPEAEIETENK